MRGPLTAAQIDTFKQLGYVIVPGFFSTEQIDAWREQIWSRTTVDPSWWPDDRFAGRLTTPITGGGKRNAGLYDEAAQSRLVYPYPEAGPMDPYPIEPSVAEEPISKAALDQLLGAGTWGSGYAAPPEPGSGAELDVLVFNYPQPEEQRAAAAADEKAYGAPHHEGFVTSKLSVPPLPGCLIRARWFVGFTFYLDDVSNPLEPFACVHLLSSGGLNWVLPAHRLSRAAAPATSGRNRTRRCTATTASTRRISARAAR